MKCQTRFGFRKCRTGGIMTPYTEARPWKFEHWCTKSPLHPCTHIIKHLDLQFRWQFMVDLYWEFNSFFFNSPSELNPNRNITRERGRRNPQSSIPNHTPKHNNCVERVIRHLLNWAFFITGFFHLLSFNLSVMFPSINNLFHRREPLRREIRSNQDSKPSTFGQHYMPLEQSHQDMYVQSCSWKERHHFTLLSSYWTHQDWKKIR